MLRGALDQRRARVVVCTWLGLSSVTACASSTAPSASPHTSSAISTGTTPGQGWHAYHLDAARSGNDTNEPSFAHLTTAWSVPPLDGAIFAEPLVDSGSVIVATENNSVYAFDIASGTQRWHVNLGSPRTSDFPCGNIRPLGITGTPVIDGGYLFVVAEVEKRSGTYVFQLAKISPSDGRVVYNRDITPPGFNANNQQQRSALAVSQGNVVIAWGGLLGDCGAYHGVVETVSEADGGRMHEWHTTPRDNEGGIWAPSGPAVDADGNIFVTTGNGSSSDVTKYDYGDSVIKLSPSLTVLSFFAPGAPQSWTSLNSGDTDLASVGPSLLPGGLLFAIGKGGRGYLLEQSKLPGNSNPGGGENYSAQVCSGTSSPAFSGMAAVGSTLYVPCGDGIVALQIDSAHTFHRLWHSSAGSGAPIVAGGLVWSMELFGGTSLSGINPADGHEALRLTLPDTTEHFATPSAASGFLFVGAGTRLVAFRPQ